MNFRSLLSMVTKMRHCTRPLQFVVYVSGMTSLVIAGELIYSKTLAQSHTAAPNQMDYGKKREEIQVTKRESTQKAKVKKEKEVASKANEQMVKQAKINKEIDDHNQKMANQLKMAENLPAEEKRKVLNKLQYHSRV